MLFALVALLAACAHAQTVGSMIGEYKWFSCKATIKQDWTGCTADIKVTDYHCVPSYSYDGTLTQKVHFSTDTAKCQIYHTADLKHLFYTKAHFIATQGTYKHVFPTCVFKCEKVKDVIAM